MSHEMKDGLKIRKMLMLIAGLVVLAGIVTLSGCFSKSTQALKDTQASLQATGSVEAKTVSASFKVPGKLDNIFVNVGDPVTSGQEIASVESSEIAAKAAQAQGAYGAAVGQQNQAQAAIGLASDTIEAKIQQAQAGLDQTRIALASAEETYNRVKSLYDSGFAAQSDYDDARHNYEAKQAQVTQLEGQLAEAQAARSQVTVYQAQYEAAAGQSEMAAGAVQEAEVYMQNTHLYSPINGYITSKIMEAGEMVNAGTPVLEITDLEHTYVQVYIDEAKIGRVQLGQTAQVTVPAYPDRVFEGTVTQISSAGQFAIQKAINEQYNHDLQSFEVRIDVPNADLALKVGMTATVKIDEATETPADTVDE